MSVDIGGEVRVALGWGDEPDCMIAGRRPQNERHNRPIASVRKMALMSLRSFCGQTLGPHRQRSRSHKNCACLAVTGVKEKKVALYISMLKICF